MHQTTRQEVFGTSSSPVAANTERLDTPMRPHCHDFLELVIVRGGHATHRAATGRTTVSAGSVLAIRPSDWHAFDDCHDLDLMLVFAGAELFRSELSWLRRDPALGHTLWPVGRSRRPQPQRQRTIDTAALDRLAGPVGELVGHSHGGPGERASRIGSLLKVIAEITPAFEAHPPLPTQVVDAVSRMEEQPARPWTLALLAETVGTSPSHLVRMFGAHLGSPPMECLNRLRAEHAAALLLETDYPVARIGREVGWTDPTYASRRFKAFFGLSPTEYRRAYVP